MINPIIHLEDNYLLFQYHRGKEYAGNKFDKCPRPERFKNYHSPYIRLKTAIFNEEESNAGPHSGLNLLERILLPSFGISSVKFYGHQSEILWSFPSAGGSYPVEIYVVIRSLDGVEPGIYYYSALQTSLFKLDHLESLHLLNKSLLPEDQNADFYFIFSVVPWRSCWKYSYRGYRFSLIDTGHVMTNFQLVIRSLGLEHSAYTCVKSKNLNTLLKLDRYEETVGIIAVNQSNKSHQVLAFVPFNNCAQPLLMDRSAGSEEMDIELFNWKPLFSFQKKVNDSIEKPAKHWLSNHSLPAEWIDNQAVLPHIIGRRSSSAYLPVAISNADFLRMITFIENLQIPIPFLYFIVHAVDGITPGIYHFDGQLNLIQAGEFRAASASLCLGQDFVYDSAVLFFFAIAASQIKEQNYSVYQQRLIDAGSLGQMLYLKSQELQLGYSAIGGYYESEVKELLQLSPKLDLHIIYSGTLGKDDPNGSVKVKKDRYILT